MKNLFTLILLTAFLTTVANAAENKPDGQNNTGGQERPEGQNRRGSPDQMARMKEHLGLSDEQTAQIIEIRKNGGGRQEIQAIFTEEQRQLIRERRGQGKGQRRNQSGNKPRANGQGTPGPSDQTTEPTEGQESTEPASDSG